MRRTLFAIAIAAMASAVNANAQFSAGVGYANELIINKEAAVLTDGAKGYAWEKDRMSLNGFYVEGAYNWEFASVGPGKFALQPAIRYYCLSDLKTNSRTNINMESEGATQQTKSRSKTRISNHVIDIPVNVKYAYDFIPGALKGYVFAGPSFSLGIAANSLTKDKGSVSYNDKTIKGEFIEGGYRYNDIDHIEGVISMARGNDPHSASSQFFICNSSSTNVAELDGKYAAFGYVVEGLSVVKAITSKTASLGDSKNMNIIANKDEQPVIKYIKVLEDYTPPAIEK